MLALLARIAALDKQIEELTRPTKTPNNSSTPPAKGYKPNRPLGGRPPAPAAALASPAPCTPISDRLARRCNTATTWNDAATAS